MACQLISCIIELECRGFVNGPGDQEFNPRSSHYKYSRVVIDASFLNTQHYKVHIKGKAEQSMERCNALLNTSVS